MKDFTERLLIIRKLGARTTLIKPLCNDRVLTQVKHYVQSEMAGVVPPSCFIVEIKHIGSRKKVEFYSVKLKHTTTTIKVEAKRYELTLAEDRNYIIAMAKGGVKVLNFALK